MAPKKTQKWGVKTRTLQLMQTVREFTWDPGGHDKQLKELKPEWFSFKQEICLWISKILTNLSNKISEEDDEPRKSKTHNLADETPDNIKIRLRLLWHWVLKHATKIIFSKSFYKRTQTGAFTSNLNTNQIKVTPWCFYWDHRLEWGNKPHI